MKRILLALTLTVFTFIGFAQSKIDSKLSITTQMLLDELNGKLEMTPSTKALPPVDRLVIGKKASLPNRFYAKPDTIKGKVYISCFIRLEDNTDTKELDAMGVVVQSKFINGLITALVPID